MSKLIDASKRIQGKSIEKVSDQKIAERLKICESCVKPNGKKMIIKITRQCKECWCVIDDKVTYAHEECPLGKW